jgi:hypothetical protein
MSSESSLDIFFGAVVRGMARDLPGTRGVGIAALSPRRPHQPPIVFATHGVALGMQQVQLRADTGPLHTVARSAVPVLSDDLWHDPRWPRLNLKYACQSLPDLSRALHETHGVIALPGLGVGGNLVVLSAYLAGPPDDDAIETMSKYERLTACAIVASSAFTGTRERTRTVLSVLRARDEVHTATGIIVSLCRTDPTTSSQLLHDVAQKAHVPPETLAAELIRVAGDQDCTSRAAPDMKARRIAGELWLALTRAG